MQFLNKANGKVFNHLTARKIALLAVEGVLVHATEKEWRRINKRARQMGLTIADEPARLTEINAMAVDIVIEEANRDLEYEVNELLEMFYILNMLEDSNDDDDEEDE